jgi:hypothetical protein
VADSTVSALRRGAADGSLPRNWLECYVNLSNSLCSSAREPGACRCHHAAVRSKYIPGLPFSLSGQGTAGDVVVMAEFAATQKREVGLRAIGAGAVDAIALLVVDPSHGEAGTQRVPGWTFIDMNHSALGDPQPDGRDGVPPRRRTPAPATLAHGDDNLSLARLVLRQAPVNPVSGQVLRPDVATEIGAVDLGSASFAANPQRLVLDAMASPSLCASTNASCNAHRGHGRTQHTLAFFVTEHRDGHQVGS